MNTPALTLLSEFERAVRHHATATTSEQLTEAANRRAKLRRQLVAALSARSEQEPSDG